MQEPGVRRIFALSARWGEHGRGSRSYPCHKNPQGSLKVTIFIPITSYFLVY